MPTTTSRLALTQPVGTDPASELRTSITGNATTLDAAAMYQSGTFAARPTASSVPAGTVYYATDIGAYYVSNGTAWAIIGTPQSGTLSARPAAGVFGRTYYATDTNQFSRDTGSAWLQLLALGVSPLAAKPVSGNYTANAGDLVLATTTLTVTLPAASANKNALIGIKLNALSGTVTVSSSGGIGFVGDASGAQTSFQLGAPFAFALLQSDGSAWQMIAGQQDTGWVSGKRVIGDRSHGVTSIVIPSGSSSASTVVAHGLGATPTQVVAGVQGTGGFAGFGVIAAPSGSNVSLQVFSTPLTTVGSNVTVAVGWTALL